MQVTKMTLTQFLDNFQAKIFKKYCGEVKQRFDIFIEIFEVDVHPLWMVTALCCW